MKTHYKTKSGEAICNTWSTKSMTKDKLKVTCFRCLKILYLK